MKLNKQELKDWWLEHVEYLDNYFPEDIEFLEIIRYTDKNDFINIMNLYGEDYILILLSFVENHQDYETCAEIIKQIKEYNKIFENNFRTKL